MLEVLWILAGIGLTYIVVSVFGEGRTSATIAGLGVALLTMWVVKSSSK